jgi:hypothetical protein
MYKDKDTKLFAGPCWDFDWGTFSYNARASRGKLFMTEAICINNSLKTPPFRALAKELECSKKPIMEMRILDSEAENLHYRPVNLSIGIRLRPFHNNGT